MWRKEENVLYFGNLPPMRKAKDSLLYIHNLYMTLTPRALLVDSSISVPHKLRYGLLNTYLRCFYRQVDVVACQTGAMKQSLESFLSTSVQLLPFYRPPVKEALPKRFDFCYIGIPSAHKNHDRFMDALSRLSREGVDARVAVTIPDTSANAELMADIERLNREGVVAISNSGLVSFEQACSIYNQSRSLFFPSLKESFGMPVVEALCLDLDLLIADLPYADALVRGGVRFDPYSVESMALAMKNFLQHPARVPKAELLTEDASARIMRRLMGEQSE
jgi:glycosyltransferase involved in cell wall biosynthesis